MVMIDTPNACILILLSHLFDAAIYNSEPDQRFPVLSEYLQMKTLVCLTHPTQLLS